MLVAGFLAFIISFDFNEKSAHAYSAGPPASRTGAPVLGAVPAELTCNSVGCHGGNALNDSRGTFQILDVPASYIPDQEYTLRVSLRMTTSPARQKFGFQLTVLDANGSGTAANAGTLSTNDARTQLLPSGDVLAPYTGRQYIEQTDTGTAGTATDESIWTIKWKAPASRGGKITFYATGNAANGSGSGGDFIYTTSAVVRPEAVTVNGASFSSTAPLTANGIGSVFGLDLANATVAATPGQPLPTTLSGTTVKVKDSLNVERDAQLFSVSPTQVNYLVPAQTATGNATVTVQSSLGTSSGRLNIVSSAPGIFTAATNGSGVAAADIQRVNSGQSTYQRVFTGTNAVPIAWNNGTESVYLLLYGTGIRGRSLLSNVTVTVGGNAQQVDYAGVQPDFTGLDQMNILLNRNLAGRGNVDVVVTIDGRVANTVTVNFQ